MGMDSQVEEGSLDTLDHIVDNEDALLEAAGRDNREVVP
jgi:hypothetical protein